MVEWSSISFVVISAVVMDGYNDGIVVYLGGCFFDFFLFHMLYASVFCGGQIGHLKAHSAAPQASGLIVRDAFKVLIRCAKLEILKARPIALCVH